MKPSVLVVSDRTDQWGQGGVFNRLFDERIKQIYQVKPIDAVSAYAETVDDGWDTVVVDCESFEQGHDLAGAIKVYNPNQHIILVHAKMAPAGKFADGCYVPRTKEALKSAFERIGNVCL